MEGLDLSGLREKAEAASPGPWVVREHPRDDSQFFVQAPRLKESDPYDIEVLGDDKNPSLYPTARADAAFIAAFDPPTALALIERVEELERRETNTILSEAEYRVRCEKAEAERAEEWRQRRDAESRANVTNAALQTVRAERDEARAALEPFGKEANKYDPPEGDDKDRIWGSNQGLTLGDLRRARSALQRKST